MFYIFICGVQMIRCMVGFFFTVKVTYLTMICINCF